MVSVMFGFRYKVIGPPAQVFATEKSMVDAFAQRNLTLERDAEPRDDNGDSMVFLATRTASDTVTPTEAKVMAQVFGTLAPSLEEAADMGNALRGAAKGQRFEIVL